MDSAEPRPQARDSAWLTNAALILFGLIYIELTRTGTHEYQHFVHGFSEDLFGQLIIYLGAIALVEHSPTNRWTLPIILLVAVFAALIAVSQPPFLSSDIYRYVWDGKVQNAGINPFRYVPADSHLSFLRDLQTYPYINRRDYAHTIYPPGAQFLFLVAARINASVTFMKLVVMAFQVATCLVLLKCLRSLAMPRERVLLYAWHPVCLWEIASSGHVDGAALTMIALAIYARLKGRSLAATSWLALAALIKLYPAALLPCFVRQRIAIPILLFLSIMVAGYLPYLGVGRGVLGFLPAYAQEEGIATGSRFFPLAFFERLLHISIARPLYIGTCALVLAILAAWAFRRSVSPTACISSGLVLATALTLCFSPHYPWYFLWLLPFLTLWPWRPAFYLVLAATYMLATQLGRPGEPIYQMNVRLYGGFFLLLALDLLGQVWSRRHEGATRSQLMLAGGENE